jgi:hypothetical protein
VTGPLTSPLLMDRPEMQDDDKIRQGTCPHTIDINDEFPRRNRNGDDAPKKEAVSCGHSVIHKKAVSEVGRICFTDSVVGMEQCSAHSTTGATSVFLRHQIRDEFQKTGSGVRNPRPTLRLKRILPTHAAGGECWLDVRFWTDPHDMVI